MKLSEKSFLAFLGFGLFAFWAGFMRLVYLLWRQDIHALLFTDELFWPLGIMFAGLLLLVVGLWGPTRNAVLWSQAP